MNAPQPNRGPDDNTHRPVTRVVCYLADPDSDTVDLDQESEEWRVLQVQHVLGGAPRAILAHDLGAAGKRIENRKLMAAETCIVEIWALDEDGTRLWPLFRGELMSSNLRLAAGAEQETVEVILPPSWFGDLCEGQQVFDPLEDELAVIHVDLEFNPLVDGRIIPNSAKHPHSVTDVDYQTWIDAESARSTEAQDLYQVTSVERWTVATAIESLQGYLNPDETNVENFEVRASPGATLDPEFRDSPKLEDLTLKRGAYLPAYLDAVLPAYGHQWTVNFNTDDDQTQITPKIFVFQRGAGTKKKLHLQAIGESLDTTKSQLVSVDVATDLSQLANVVVAHGSLEEREVTIELSRGWGADHDADGPADKTSESFSLADDNTWRKWVGNEGGDYIDTRPEITEALDLSTVFEEGYVPKRRPLEDCLTYRAALEKEAARQPPILEYSVDDGDTWTRYGKDDWRVLTHELGVYLTDPEGGGIAALLSGAGANAKLRITGTLRGDKRLNHEVDRTDDSPTSIETRLFLDLSHRFHSRQRVSDGPHASTLSGAYDERDDQDELEDFVEKIADNVKAAVISTSAPLSGLVFDYLIGDIIEEIAGRNISLNRLASTTQKKGVQIVGIAWDVQAQRTMLTVAPFDSYVPQFESTPGGSLA